MVLYCGQEVKLWPITFAIKPTMYFVLYIPITWEMQIFAPRQKMKTARLPQIQGGTYYNFLLFCMQHLCSWFKNRLLPNSSTSADCKQLIPTVNAMLSKCFCTPAPSARVLNDCKEQLFFFWKKVEHNYCQFSWALKSLILISILV